MSEPQARQGSALNPITHFLLTPIFVASLAFAIYLTAHRRADNPVLYPWLIVLFVALILLNMQSRLYALRVQDRVIRLEEQLRIFTLVPGQGAALAGRLTTPQLIGLRFASDAELPALATRAADQNLSQKDIKAEIRVWRPDHARI